MHATLFAVANEPGLQEHKVNAMIPAGESVFSGQSKHATAVPWACLYFPAAHTLHVIPFNAAVDPALQVHDVTSKLPAGEFALVVQSEHALAVPRWGLNLPIAQALHTAPLLEAMTQALQLHAMMIVLATNESVFNGPSIQGPMPCKFLYFPVVHGSHAIAMNKTENRGLHRHKVISVVPMDDFVFVGHVVHESAGPRMSLYVPAGQNEHGVPFALAVDPVLQMHDVISMLEMGELVFVGHAKRAPGPPKFLYSPVLHASHV